MQNTPATCNRLSDDILCNWKSDVFTLMGVVLLTAELTNELSEK